MQDSLSPKTELSKLQHFHQDISNVSISGNSKAFVGAHFHYDNDRRRQISEKPWTIPRTSHPLFTGRQRVRKRLATVLNPADPSTPACQKCFVISGLGGTGKSEVCIKFAEEHRDDYWGTFWLDVRSPSSVQQGCDSICEQCDVEDPSISNVKRILSQCTKPWLLFIDNADDSNTDYSQFLPPAGHGHVIFTTRNPDLAGDYATVGHEVLDCLEPAEATELLFHAASMPQTQWHAQKLEADVLVESLGRHTLAIVQAGTYIKINKLTSPSEYLTLFTQKRDRLLRYHSKQRVSTYGSVFATFEVSAAKLQGSDEEADRDALQLLEMLAFMHYNGHNEQTFHEASMYAQDLTTREDSDSCQSVDFMSKEHATRLPEFQQVQNAGRLDDILESRRRKALLRLASLSYITLHSNVGKFLTFSLHQLVHAWALERIVEDNRVSAWLTTATVLGLSSQWNPTYHPSQHILSPQIQALMNHQEQASAVPVPDMQCAQLLFQFARVLHVSPSDNFKLDELIQLVRKRAQHVQEGGEDKSSLAIDALVAVEASRRGDGKKAIQLLKHVASVQERTIEDKHPHRRFILYSLARAYLETEQTQRAVGILEQLVKVPRETLDEMRENLGPQSLLGLAYRINGQDREANAMIEWVVERSKQLLSENDPYILNSHSLLAFFRIADGQYEQAAIILEGMVTTQSEKFGEKHPSQLASQFELARACLGCGHMKKAVVILERLAMVLDDPHPQRLELEHLLSVAYSLVDPKDPRVTQLLEKVSAAPGEDNNPHRLQAQLELAQNHVANGLEQKATKILERLLTVFDEMDPLWQESQDLLVDISTRLKKRRTTEKIFGKRIERVLCDMVDRRVERADRVLERWERLRKNQASAKTYPRTTISWKGGVVYIVVTRSSGQEFLSKKESNAG
ncbi:MAG: hypothetical protein M1831_004495 [Alyxoria varia]|nr:MAG: hypothetical protein M1831_004495 [Alyxoria varia]